ncbi:MAG TPA: hypothetical protein PKC13_01595 [Blastocatellia bacterium]|nr:hypothetical protein [Blastocatellia bacterium]HMX24289.1 hypothetical protein [Blastocatellia bacterium]HMY75390.1 hypothetical protein [Blastocatellia bacterium]HNG28642.1 hypothetical protein [Blastocatellia bacterium]
MKRQVETLSYSKTFSLWVLLALVLLPAAAFSDDRRIGNDKRDGQAGDQQPSSVLVYNYYTSSASDPAQTDTQISLTNTNRESSAFVHLFFITKECFLADAYACVTANQTVTFPASDVDPGSTGYIIAVATDSQIGCPISFNHLIGSEAVKVAGGRSGSLNAEGFSALYNGRFPGCKSDTTVVSVVLDGDRYEAAPRELAVDKVYSLADGYSTLLVVNSLNMEIVPNPSTHIGSLFGVLYDDVENAASFTRQVSGCQLAEVLSNTFPQTTPAFSTFVPAGRGGWIRLMSQEGKGVSGAVINFNPNAATKKGIFNNSHNLHHLSYTPATIKVPVFPPSC